MNNARIFDSETKFSKVCRCCLKEDGSSNIFACFPNSELKETYKQMLKDTFNIQISLHPSISKCLICESCIEMLRNASTFKQMVQQNEHFLVEYSKTLQLEEENKTFIKELGPIKIEEEITDYSEDRISDDDDEILASIKLNLAYNDRTEKKCKIKEKSLIESIIPPQKDWKKITERRGTGPLLRENSLKLILHSNLCVFQWNKSQYRCFCCNIPFSDINILKKHTLTEHTLDNIEKKIIQQQNRLVKVEITNLECKVCRENIGNIPDLTQHLSKIHSIDTGEHLLVPFRIEKELKCQICLKTFSVFRLLNIHVNRHFQKQVCHICGAGFSNLVFLNLHKTRSHRRLDCKSCNLTFNSRSDKKHHDTAEHGIKYVRKLRFPCPFCPERFLQENLKVKHMVDKHEITKPEFKCSVCPKSFLTKSLCNNHIKNVHNKEKNKECEVCHTFFYTNSDLVRHKVTHTGEKKFACVVCNNSFASRDSLRRHMKRTHVSAA